jgi:hypothetical protein
MYQDPVQRAVGLSLEFSTDQGSAYLTARPEVLAASAAAFNNDVKEALECVASAADAVLEKAEDVQESEAQAFLSAEEHARKVVGATIVVLLGEEATS